MSFHLSLRFIKCSLVLAAVLLCPALRADDEKADAQPDAPKHPWHIIGSKTNPDVFPIIVTDGESCLQLKLYDLEVRKLHLTLKNISKGLVKIKTIMPACPCLSLPEPIKDVTLEPNSTIPVDFTITARKLKPGNFDRFFFVDVDGYEIPARLPIKGEIKEILKYTPNKIIQLGTFIGDVPWTRTFTIESLLEPDKLSLKAPEEHKHFNVTVTKESPTAFKVTVSPKGKLPEKALKEAIPLTVEGVPGYGPAEVGIICNAIGWALTLQKSNIALAKRNINHEEPLSVEAKLILKSDKSVKISKMPRPHRNKVDNPDITVISVADNEEEQTHPLSSPETWKPLLNDISVERLPENVTLEKIPSNGGIVLKFTLPAGFFKSSTTSMKVPIRFKGNIIAAFKVVAR